MLVLKSPVVDLLMASNDKSMMLQFGYVKEKLCTACFKWKVCVYRKNPWYIWSLVLSKVSGIPQQSWNMPHKRRGTAA